MSAYTRKTVDEYEIQGDYGHGWEMLTTEETRGAARKMLLCYQRNEPRARHRIKRKRVPIEEVTPDQGAGGES